MQSTFTGIEDMILEHIEEIDNKIHDLDYKFNKTPDSFGDLFKAKSLALQSLTDLKVSRDG